MNFSLKMVIKVFTKLGQNVEKLHKLSYTDPYVWWCEETGVNYSLLLDFKYESHSFSILTE